MEVLKDLPIMAASDVPAPPFPLKGKNAAMVLFSFYPEDPRPRRAAEAMVSAGMSVDLICIRENKEEARREVFNGVDIRRVPVNKRRGGVLGYLYQYAAFLFMSSWIIAVRSLSRRYDLVYVNNMPDFLVLSGLIPKLFGAKVLLDIHDPMPELMMTIFELPKEARSVDLLKFEEKWSMWLADSIVTVNQACARIFASRSCPSKKITVVMNSPDEKIFEFRDARPFNGAQRGNKPFVIMYHGSLVERNGLELAIKAFARVRATIPNAELRIYGSRNAFLDRMMESVRSQGMEDSVHYLGPKPQEKIVEAIEESDVGVIPNLRSIFTELNTPTRIFEYLALGKPVITPRSPGITDYFDDDSLIFFELGDEVDLARKIEFVFNRPDKAVDITKRGQEVHQAHMWREERLKLIGLMTSLLSS
jgi:glycosyltransferase involved in cell wall biosynthesis